MAGWMIRFSLRNRLLVLALTALLFAVGIFSMGRLTLDAVPDITNIQVSVVTASPSLGPVEIEQYLTYAVESSLSGLPGVEEMRSVSRYGVSSVVVVFEEGTPLWFARQLVQERLPEAREKIPEGLGSPEMVAPSTGLGEVYQFVLESPDHDAMELRSILDWQVAYRLRQVPGVVEVNAWGGYEKQFQVAVSPAALRTQGVSLSSVYDAVTRSNALAGSASIEKRQEQILIRGEGLVRTARDLENVVVETREGAVPVRVHDIGRVVEGGAPRRASATRDGAGETVIGMALMLAGENAREVTRRIQDVVREIQGDLPAGVVLRPYYERTDLIDRTLATVSRNLLEGCLLVVAVLFLLLGNLRGGLIVASAIPLSMLFAFTGMAQARISGNLMSLGAIDFGLLVDGSVVMVENILRVLSHEPAGGRSLRDRVLAAALEVGRPVVFAVGIIIIVYLPILTLTGTEGKMFRPMAWTVVFALAGSLLVALTVVPVLCSLAFRHGVRERETWVLRTARGLYAPTLDFALRRPLAVALGSAACVAAAALAAARLGGEFLPTLDEGDLVVQTFRPTSVSMSQSIATGLEVERVLRTFPEVRTVVTRTGTPEVASDVMGIELSDVFIILRPRGEWPEERPREELIEAMEAALSDAVPGVGLSFTQPIEMRFNELISGVRSDIALKIHGDDLEELHRLAVQAAHTLEGIDGARDVRVEQQHGLQVLRIILDRSRLARYGISADEALGVVEAVKAGRRAGTVMDGVRRYDIAVRFDLPEDIGLETIRNLPVFDPDGHPVPLGQLADIRIDDAPAQISREWGQRRITIECNVRGRDLESFVREARQALDAEVPRPEGYYVSWGGTFEQLERGRQRLMLVVPSALLLILFLLYGAFGSFRLALVVFSGIPLAAVGGIFALLVRGIPFSISAGVGFIALFGIAVLNGVVMVSSITRLRQDGLAPDAAVRAGAMLRLRPVLTTALVASFGFIPMALSHGAGAEVQRPLATVVIGGLVSSTLLTLVLLPVLYRWFGGEPRDGADPPAAP